MNREKGEEEDGKGKGSGRRLVFRDEKCIFVLKIKRMKERLLGKTPAELTEIARACGLPAFAGKQMAQWLYQKRVRSIAEMTNLSKQGREALSEKYEVGLTGPRKAGRVLHRGRDDSGRGPKNPLCELAGRVQNGL